MAMFYENFVAWFLLLYVALPVGVSTFSGLLRAPRVGAQTGKGGLLGASIGGAIVLANFVLFGTVLEAINNAFAVFPLVTAALGGVATFLLCGLLRKQNA